jgi:tungstate transport system substrate-binding protein
MSKRLFLVFALAALLIHPSARAAEQKEPVRVRMATTTSTEETGLLEVILPPFEEMLNVKIDVISVGSGKAMKLGENGDVDIILVHARDAESTFVASGYGVNRRDVMYNDFVIVGPRKDPAKVSGLTDAAETFKRIAAGYAPFVSRGDDSGTHMKEKAIWRELGLTPKGSWYIEAGQGMSATLQIANEKKAYCLCDRASYVTLKDKLQLPILCEGDKRLFNPYGVIAVSPAMHPTTKYVYAMALIGWLTSPQCQKMIGDFKKAGTVLFHPDAWETQGP